MPSLESDERGAFRSRLAAHIAEQFPDAQLSWLEDGRRLLLAFADGCTCTLYEPNYFSARASSSDAELLARAVRAIAGQRQQLRNQIGAD